MTLPLGQIVQGDCLEVMRGWPSASVHLCVTSPPYWALRDYQVAGESLAGQLGREPTPDAHVAALVALFGEVRRVLRPDGVLVVNYGDMYANRGYGAHATESDVGGWDATRRAQPAMDTANASGIAPKNMVGMAWRLALALQADGWTWRAWWPWVKRTCLPESAPDRPVLSVEPMLMLTPRAGGYYWDRDAIRHPHADYRSGRNAARDTCNASDAGVSDAGVRKWNPANNDYNPAGRNRRTGDWWVESLAVIAADLAALYDVQANGGVLVGHDGVPIGQYLPTQPYAGAHYATYPEALVDPLVAAGTSERGACPACGAPWRRVVARAPVPHDAEISGKQKEAHAKATRMAKARDASRAAGARNDNPFDAGLTTGWQPGCACDAGEPVPCVVLDPFAGSGTTGVVAHKRGRRFVGVDLAGGDAPLGIVVGGPDLDGPHEVLEVLTDPRGYRLRVYRDAAGVVRRESVAHHHTAKQRLDAAAEGRTLAEHAEHVAMGQTSLLDAIAAGGAPDA